MQDVLTRGARVHPDELTAPNAGAATTPLLNEVLAFNPAQGRDPTQAFTRKASLRQARAGLGLSVVSGNLYAIGGGWMNALNG